MKKILRRNKRGSIYAILLVLIAIILVGYSMYLFVSMKQKVNSGLSSPTEIIGFNQENERALFYDHERVRLAAVQAFADVAAQGAVLLNENCKFSQNTVIFNPECEPDINQIAKIFIEKLEANQVVQDFDFTIEGQNDLLRATAQPTEKKIELKKAFASYTVKYDYDPSFSFNLKENGLDLGEFVKAYNKAKDTSTVSPENFVQATSSVENLYIFKTKDYFFYEKNMQNVFAPIEFDFYIE